ncbi:hypothetical protein [Cellulomonas hominis]|nr:hypothetical protein [Cellulomonas hominis]
MSSGTLDLAFRPLLSVRSGRGEEAAGAPPEEPPVDPDITPR